MRSLPSLLLAALLVALAACGNSEAGAGAGGAGGAPVGGGGGSGGGAGGDGGGGPGGSGGGGEGGSAVSARCSGLCDAFVAAGCSSGPTPDGCLLVCKSLTSAPSCDAQALPYLDCVDAATIECNGAGDPVATGCGLAYLAAIDCAVTTSPNPAMVAPCEDYCGRIVATGCPGNGTEAECRSNCLWAGNTGTGCDGEWATFLGCAHDATMICLVGYAVAQGCGPDFRAYKGCIDAAAGR